MIKITIILYRYSHNHNHTVIYTAQILQEKHCAERFTPSNHSRFIQHAGIIISLTNDRTFTSINGSNHGPVTTSQRCVLIQFQYSPLYYYYYYCFFLFFYSAKHIIVGRIFTQRSSVQYNASTLTFIQHSTYIQKQKYECCT